jgi:molecular chaperone GrpE
MSEKAGAGAGSGDHDVPDIPSDSRAAQEPEDASNAVAELEARLVRALADLANLRKRYERELHRERLHQRARVVAEWLPVIDNLELALRHAGSKDSGLTEGVAAVHDQAVAVLDRLGFRRFEDVGRAFDPTRHDAVSSSETDVPFDTVLAAVRPGYASDDDILRPAKVVVGRPRAVARDRV